MSEQFEVTAYHLSLITYHQLRQQYMHWPFKINVDVTKITQMFRGITLLSVWSIPVTLPFILPCLYLCKIPCNDVSIYHTTSIMDMRTETNARRKAKEHTLHKHRQSSFLSPMKWLPGDKRFR